MINGEFILCCIQDGEIKYHKPNACYMVRSIRKVEETFNPGSLREKLITIDPVILNDENITLSTDTSRSPPATEITERKDQSEVSITNTQVQSNLQGQQDKKIHLQMENVLEHKSNVEEHQSVNDQFTTNNMFYLIWGLVFMAVVIRPLSRYKHTSDQILHEPP